MVDDESGADAERELLDRIAAAEPTTGDDGRSLLGELRPGGARSPRRRVIVCTKYLDTWLAGLLARA